MSATYFEASLMLIAIGLFFLLSMISIGVIMLSFGKMIQLIEQSTIFKKRQKEEKQTN